MDLLPEEQKVIAVPEIRTLELTDDDEFFILGCDGVFELNTSQKAVDIVREGLRAGLSVEQATEELVDRSCSPDLRQTMGKGGDNCSAVVVRLERSSAFSKALSFLLRWGSELLGRTGGVRSS